MKAKSTISELWKQGFFEKKRTVKEVDQAMYECSKATCANTAVLLKSCKELRKDDGGWIQKYQSTAKTSAEMTSPDYFALLDVHPEIVKVSQKLFNDGHYDMAVFKAFKRLNNMVREKSDRQDLDGRDLMQQVFNRTKPLLKFNKLQSRTDTDEQEGMMFLYAGAMAALRNPPAHEDTDQGDQTRAVELLALASFLCKRLHGAQK